MIILKEIIIETKYPDDIFSLEENKKYPNHVSLQLIDTGKESSIIEFVALWIKNPTLLEQNIDFHEFNIGDYRVTNFNSRTRGHGTFLHDFLRNEIKERLDGKVVNIYSSKRSEIANIESFSPYAEIFWQKRVDKKLAVFDSALDRYRLLFRD